MIETALNHEVEYNVLQKRNYGTVVQNILDKGRFLQVLKTQPNNIKLSDWRNIAYHHTYEIVDGSIKCNYGKKGQFFIISQEELYSYTVQIIKDCNIIDIGRRIFLYDNSDVFSEDFDSHYINYYERKEMKISQLKTAMLSQGFKLMDLNVDKHYQVAITWDLRRNNLMNKEEKTKREIHCSQFLYNIWLEFPSDEISILYCDRDGKKMYQYSVSGQVCNGIVDRRLEFRQMFGFLNIKKIGFDN